MTNSASCERDPGTPIWEYVKLGDFSCPAASTQEIARAGLRGLLSRFGLSIRSRELADAQDEFSRLPGRFCDQVAPEPDWSDPLAALDKALQSGFSADAPTAPGQVVVGAPYSGGPEVLARWAKTRDISMVEPPPPETLLRGNADWFEGVAEMDQEPLVITHLERCYLRHHDGLRPMRRLLDWLSKRQGACVLGCCSWSWAYLSKALHAAALFPQPWALQALDEQRLRQWFARLAASQGKSRVVFRQASVGKIIIRAHPVCEPAGAASGAGQDRGPGDDEPQPSKALIDLAARSRGNPGVALALWRHSLRLAPDGESSAAAPGHTVWVKPWSELVLPTPTESPERDTLQILHTLLLHDGLSAPLLSELLPLSRFEVMRRLRRLQSEGLVTAADDRWRVAPLGYPAVRQELLNEGYLVDVF